MKLHFLLFALILFGSSKTTVQAATGGAIKIEGLVQNGTCNLAAGDVDRTIELDSVSVDYFKIEKASLLKTFDLTAHCDPSVRTVTFKFSGTPDAVDSWRFANTGTAKGISLWLTSNNGGSTIRANGTDSARTVPVENGVALLPLGAAYWKISDVNVGTLVSRVIVDVTYN